MSAFLWQLGQQGWHNWFNLQIAVYCSSALITVYAHPRHMALRTAYFNLLKG